MLMYPARGIAPVPEGFRQRARGLVEEFFLYVFGNQNAAALANLDRLFDRGLISFDDVPEHQSEVGQMQSLVDVRLCAAQLRGHENLNLGGACGSGNAATTD